MCSFLHSQSVKNLGMFYRENLIKGPLFRGF